MISPLLVSLPSVAAPEEVLGRPPREAWPLARVLNALSMKMGRTGLLAKPRHGPRRPRLVEGEAAVGILGTGVPRLACLRPMAWLC